MRLLERQTAAGRQAQLEFNERMRRERLIFRTPANDGYINFNMPEADYYYWIFHKPELRFGDPEQRKRAWDKFLRSDEGRKYTLNPYEGRKSPTHKGIIVR